MGKSLKTLFILYEELSKYLVDVYKVRKWREKKENFDKNTFSTRTINTTNCRSDCRSDWTKRRSCHYRMSVSNKTKKEEKNKKWINKSFSFLHYLFLVICAWLCVVHKKLIHVQQHLQCLVFFVRIPKLAKNS